jgi:hypothetical protein
LDTATPQAQRKLKAPFPSTAHSPSAYGGVVKILQIAPALHGAQMQTKDGTLPVVVWALVENDDGGREVIGLAVGGPNDRPLVPPNPATFESYHQTG